MKYISPWYYGNEALEITQWQDVSNITCEIKDQPCLENGQDVLEFYSMDKVSLHYK
jgi:hypothetical protein